MEWPYNVIIAALNDTYKLVYILV